MTTPIATFSGIGSGLDSSTLITSMVTAEKQPETAMKQHQSDLQSQMSILSTIASGLKSVGDMASQLNSASEVQALSATSANSGIVGASASAYATAGTWRVSVQNLATAQTSLSKGVTQDVAGDAGSGTLTLSVGGKTPPYSVDYGSNDTLASIAASINNTAGGDLTASVIFDGTNYHLMVTGNRTGQANAVTFTDSGANGGLGMQTQEPATDAAFTVNGVPLTRSSNTVSDAINGVTLNLNATTPTGGSSTAITVGTDTSALATKINNLVQAYNGVAQLVSSQLNYTGVTKGADTLFGDSTIQGLQQQLGDLFANAYTSSGGTITTSDLGISVASDGTLSLDQNKLTQALTANPKAAQQLLVGDGSNGLTAAISTMVTQYTAYGTGALVTAQATKQTQVDSYTDQIAAVESKASTLEDTLRAQFTKLDQVMSQLTSQQQYLNMMFNTASTSSSSK